MGGMLPGEYEDDPEFADVMDRVARAAQQAPARGGMLSSPETDPYYYYKLRQTLPPDSPLHAVYGPLEHGQAMREQVSRDPWSAPLFAGAIPVYSGLKALGLTDARSPASMEEMSEAYKGVGRGMLDWLGSLMAQSQSGPGIPGVSGRKVPNAQPAVPLPATTGVVRG